MQKPLFKDAKFGAKYITTDGKLAIFISQDEESVVIIIEGDQYPIRIHKDTQDIIAERERSAYSRSYFQRRKAESPDYCKLRYQRTIEARRAYNREYRKTHKELVKANYRKYQLKHKEQINKKEKHRRWLKGGAARQLDKMGKQIEQMSANIDNQLKDFDKLFRDFE